MREHIKETCLNMTQDELTLSTVLSEIGSSYKGVDVRAVLVRPTSTLAEWICAFLMLRFTNERMEEVKQAFEEIEGRIGIQNEDNLKVRQFYYDMKGASEIVNCISKGHVGLQDCLAVIRGNYAQIKTGHAINHNGFADSQYLYKMIYSSKNHDFIVPFLENSVGKRNVNLQKISELLGINNLQDVQANNVLVLFPLYVNRLELNDNDRGRKLCTYEVDRYLGEKCEIRLTVSTKEGKRQG